MKDYTEGYAVPGDVGSIIDVIDPETGLTSVYKETLEGIRQRYPHAERIKIADWTAAKAATQDTPITWTRTTKAKYWEMLEVLPPALWIGGAFLVGEPCDHHATTGQPRFQGYWEKNTGLLSVRTGVHESAYFVASRPMTCAELRKEVQR